MKVENAWWSKGNDGRAYVEKGGALRWFPVGIGGEVSEEALQEQATPMGVKAFVRAKGLSPIQDAAGGDACLRTWGIEVNHEEED